MKPARSGDNLLSLTSAKKHDRNGIFLGHITGWRAGLPLVLLGPGEEPAVARMSRRVAKVLRVTTPIDVEVVVASPNNPEASPVILDLVEEHADERETIGTSLDPAAVDARVDGKRVVLEGHDEVVLRCGASSITLRRNGRVVIRGVYVESRSKGTNRIKGGSVQIN